MGLRTIRLDKYDEETLTYVQQRTGLTASEAFKQGLKAYAVSLKEEATEMPIEVYRRLDMGSGGYAVAPATEAKSAVREVIRKRYRRDPG